MSTKKPKRKTAYQLGRDAHARGTDHTFNPFKGINGNKAYWWDCGWMQSASDRADEVADYIIGKGADANTRLRMRYWAQDKPCPITGELPPTATQPPPQPTCPQPEP